MICKLCGRIIYDEICYTKDPRFCLDCGSNRHQYFKQRRDTLSSLREMNLESKIVQTKYLIREAVSEFGLDKVYISYSGGKDSTVLSHIARASFAHQFKNAILHFLIRATCWGFRSPNPRFSKKFSPPSYLSIHI